MPTLRAMCVMIRPRRFGKSLWVSVLENYYDRTRADEWHAVFDGTDIGRRPTEGRSRYVILRFNLSAFDDTLETLRERFETYCLIEIRAALERNADLSRTRPSAASLPSMTLKQLHRRQPPISQ